MAWEPNFRMGQVNTGPAVSDILNRGIGGFLDKRVQQLTSEEDKKQQQANLDRAYALQVSADKRAQELAARQATEFDRKLLGEQNLGQYASRLSGGLTRGEMSQVNADKANMMLDDLMAKGMSAEQAGAKVFGTYNDAGKQMTTGTADKLLQFKAPQTTAEKIAYIKGAGFESPDYDASKLLDYRDKILSPLETQLRDENRMAFEAQQNLLKEKGENARLGRRLAADKANAEAKEPTFEPFFVTQVTKDGTSKIAVKNPAQLASISRYDPKTGAFLGLKEGFTMGDFTPKTESDKKASTVYAPDRVTRVEKIFGTFKPDRSEYMLQAADAVTRMKTQSGKKIDPDTAIGIVDAARKKGGTMGIWDNIRLQDINAELLHRGYIKDVESEGLKADNKFE